jgi:D-alanyl-D-alanine carboxypeptidase
MFLVGLVQPAFAQQADSPVKTQLTGEIQQILADEVRANPSLPGELLHLTVPNLGLNTSFAAGLFDRESKRPLDPHHLFRIASVTKTFTAAAILRLFEAGKIKLDEPINRYLPSEYIELLEKDGYRTQLITVRHLLTHTGGIHDYGTDPRYFTAVQNDPKHRWTRMEQVQSAIHWGQPQFEPGQSYQYSDTGYILLGEMIERLTTKSLGEAFRSLINYQKLGLDETYLETLEAPPAGSKGLSHPYFGDLDTVELDASHDLYGGGGLVSSTEDLALFYRALLTGRIFERDSTLQTMLKVPATNENAPGGAYAMGITRREISGVLCWGHRGFWGTSAYYCPAPDVTVVRQLNQAQRDNSFVFDNLYEQVFARLKIGKSGGPAPNQTSKPLNGPTLSKEQWREYLRYFANELAKRHKNLYHSP